jgi:hypothetical protein
MGKVLFLFLILFGVKSFGQTFTCKDLSRFSNGAMIRLSMEDIENPGIQVIDKNGRVRYDEEKALELEDTADSSFMYYSYDVELLISLGYLEDDYDTTHVKFDIDKNELTITAYIGGEEAEYTSYACTASPRR